MDYVSNSATKTYKLVRLMVENSECNGLGLVEILKISAVLCDLFCLVGII